jgi:hypothetical protein
MLHWQGPFKQVRRIFLEVRKIYIQIQILLRGQG